MTRTAPILLLDLDTPLADFDAQTLTMIRDAGFDIDIAGLGDQTHRYMTDHIVSPAHRRMARNLIEQPGWFRSLPVVPGAQECVAALFDAGVDVWVCTKPLEANPTCRDDKGAWLREHFPDLEDRLIIAPDKSLIVGDVLLDDAPHPSWLDRAAWDPVVFATTYNGPGTAWDGLPRFSWSDPIDTLLDLVFA